MKLTAFLFFVFLFQIQLKIYSQHTKITLELDNVKVEEVLNKIEALTEYLFFVDTKEVDLERKVTVVAYNKSVSFILEKLFFNNFVSFELLGKHIILKKLQKSSLFSEEGKIEENYLILGGVVDVVGNPLTGVNVIVEGDSIGVFTDFDGQYRIKTSSSSILIFSYTGMKTQKIRVGNKKNINITLRDNANALEEVVVVGYGFKKKINLSGAVGQVDSKFFESRSVVNIGQALQGAIGNLNITTAAGPNDVPSFNIRGSTSLAGGEPLVVIDGISATQKDLGRMNPNDIASISVLKDAASASIYGARASFGVILVTTKKGKSDKIQVNVNVNTSIKTLGRTPELELDPYKVASFKDIMGLPWYDLYSNEQLEYAKKVSQGLAPATRISPSRPDRYEYYHQTNWKKIILKKISYTNTINMNISQKIDKGSYYFAVEGVTNEGIYNYNNDIHKRLNLRLKADYELSNWLTLSNNTWVYSNKYDESNATGSSFFREIVNRFTLDPLYNPDGSYTYSYARMIGRLEAGNYTTSENNYQTKFAVNMSFFDAKLKIVADASYKRLLTDREAFDTPVAYSEGPGHTAVTGPASAWARFQNWKEETNNYNVYATFKDTYLKKHSLTILAGYNQEEFFYNATSGERANLISVGLPTVELATGNQTVGQSKLSWAVQGLFGRVNYIFDEKYIVEANMRYDGSSSYFKEDRWVLNPSGAVSWILSKENFLKNSFFNLLKFRASYGSLGNQGASTYATYDFINIGNTNSLHGGEFLVKGGAPVLVAPSFTWETIQTKNMGVDVSFFNNRLTSSFDYYHRTTLDMFAPGLELPAQLGADAPSENATDMVTKGWEFALDWKDQFSLIDKPFQYSVSFNLSDSRAWITKYPNPTGQLNQYYEGQELGEIWGFVTDGYYQTQEEIDLGPDITDVASYPSTRPTLPGDNKFTDLNNDGAITFGDSTLDNPGDRKIIGNSRARYNFGLDLNASWNNFDLRAFFQGVGKRDYYPRGSGGARNYFWAAFAFPWGSVTKENYNNHWTPTNRNAFYPRPKSYVAETPFAEVGLTQTRWLQDASYIRLKNITMGYTIPSNASEKIGIQKLRIYLSGENLLEITQLFKYLDPENLNGDGYPFRRTYALGISLKF